MTRKKVYSPQRRYINGRKVPEIHKGPCDSIRFIPIGQIAVSGPVRDIRRKVIHKGIDVGAVRIHDFRTRENPHPEIHTGEGIAYRKSHITDYLSKAFGFEGKYDLRGLMR